MLGTGLPMGLQFSITAIGSVLVQWSVNGLGVNAVAAVSGAVKLSAFFACFFDALATTIATYAGQNMGARKLDRIHQGLRCTAGVGFIYCLVTFGVVMLFSGPLLGMFIDANAAPEVTAMGIQYLTINVAFYIPLLFVNILRLSISPVPPLRCLWFLPWDLPEHASQVPQPGSLPIFSSSPAISRLCVPSASVCCRIPTNSETMPISSVYIKLHKTYYRSISETEQHTCCCYA